MLDKIKKLEKIFFSEIVSIKNKDDIEKIRIKYLSRKGLLSELSKNLLLYMKIFL